MSRIGINKNVNLEKSIKMGKGYLVSKDSNSNKAFLFDLNRSNYKKEIELENLNSFSVDCLFKNFFITSKKKKKKVFIFKKNNFLYIETNEIEIVEIETDRVIKNFDFKREIIFSKWIDNETIAFASNDQFYHWNFLNQKEPKCLFVLSNEIREGTIFGYQTVENRDWQLLKSFQNNRFSSQLYSLERNLSQNLPFLSILQPENRRVYIQKENTVSKIKLKNYFDHFI